MIASILDTDLYKFTTSYAYMKLYPEAEGIFAFIDRDNVEYSKEFVTQLTAELHRLSKISLTADEFAYLTHNKTLTRFMPLCYWEWLAQFRFEPDRVNVRLDDSHHLHVEITDKLYKSTLYEVPILATISELRAKQTGYVADMDTMVMRLHRKIKQSNVDALKFSEFGTRRRFSYDVHRKVCEELSGHAKYCVGTSNVHLAMQYDMMPAGTFPHEWVMFHGAVFGYQMANYLSLEDWSRVYDGDLGIALIDTYTTRAFLSNFSRKHAKLFDGVRQDSGDEYQIGDMVIKRYQELGIDPRTKTIVFSNATDFDKYAKIAAYFRDRINVSAGIGTNLTNDVGFVLPNVVMKLTNCRISQRECWKPCLKISDDVGKHLGCEQEFKVAAYVLGL